MRKILFFRLTGLCLLWVILLVACGSDSAPTQPLRTPAEQRATQPAPPTDPPPLPTATPTEFPAVTANRAANLRAGPGTEYEVVGGAQPGQRLSVVARNEAGDWYQLKNGTWIAAFLVDGAPANWAVAAAPGLPVINTPVPALPRSVPPTAAPSAGVLLADSEEAQVTNVVDGDTIDVLINGQTYRVRYILMNTPERNDYYGPEATQKNRELVTGQRVFLEKDVSETDRYGRLLRYVYLAPMASWSTASWCGWAMPRWPPSRLTYATRPRCGQRSARGDGGRAWVVGGLARTTNPAGVQR